MEKNKEITNELFDMKVKYTEQSPDEKVENLHKEVKSIILYNDIEELGKIKKQIKSIDSQLREELSFKEKEVEILRTKLEELLKKNHSLLDINELKKLFNQFQTEITNIKSINASTNICDEKFKKIKDKILVLVEY